MSEKLIRFGHQLFNNLDVFCFGIIIAIAGIFFIKMIVTIRQNKRNSIKKSLIGVEDLLLPLIGILLVIAIILLAKSWNGKDITDANVLSAIVSFISPFIAFTGAYSLAEYNNKRSEEIRKDKEYKEKLAKEEQYKKEMEHKKYMLFTMLEYSITQTRIATNEIENQYKNNYKGLNIGQNVFLHKKYNLTGKLKDDFKTMIFVKSQNDYKAYMNFYRQLDGTFTSMLDKHKISDRVIYIKDWYNYLDCVSDFEDLNTIILWINLLNYNKMDVDSYTYMFISNRCSIDRIIKKYYPNAIDEGVRGKYGIKI